MCPSVRPDDTHTAEQPSSLSAMQSGMFDQCQAINIRSTGAKRRNKKNTSSLSLLHLIFARSRPLLFSLWLMCNQFLIGWELQGEARQPVGAISDLCLGHCFLLSTLKYLRIRPWIIKKSCFKSFTSLCGKTAGLLKCYWAAEDLFFVGLQKAPWQSEEMDNWANVIELTTKSRCNYDSGVISG